MSDDEFIYGLSFCDQRMIAAFHAEREAQPDLEPYVGPGESLEKFLAGAVITHRTFIMDDSPWVARNIHPAQMRRLRYMLTSTSPHDEVCDCRPLPGFH